MHHQGASDAGRPVGTCQTQKAPRVRSCDVLAVSEWEGQQCGVAWGVAQGRAEHQEMAQRNLEGDGPVCQLCMVAFT